MAIRHKVESRSVHKSLFDCRCGVTRNPFFVFVCFSNTLKLKYECKVSTIVNEQVKHSNTQPVRLAGGWCWFVPREYCLLVCSEKKVLPVGG
jgi:hypothetical protein